MADLNVDVVVLEATQRSLSTLKSEFDGIEDRRDDTSDIWGHDDVKAAMDEFASTMKQGRVRLRIRPRPPGRLRHGVSG